MRKGAVSRKTNETAIEVAVDLDGSGKADVSTGVGFFDHMLDQLARHSLDRPDDPRRGRPACRRPPHGRGRRHRARPGAARGARRQARRRALRRLPAADGRSADARRARRVGTPVSGLPRRIPDRRRSAPSTSSWCASSFRRSAVHAGLTLHIETLYGANSHHIAESCFKGVARALGAALAIDPRQAARIPSTKGAL